MNASLQQAIVRIAQEDKATKALIQSLEAKVGPLASLPTVAKENLVAAIIELHNSVQTKVNEQFVIDQKVALKSEILGGAGEAVDTLKELADLWANQNADLSALVTLIGSKVSFTTAQELTSEQKAIVLNNIGAVAIATYEALQARVAAAETAISGLQGQGSTQQGQIDGLTTQLQGMQQVQSKSVRVDIAQNFTDEEKAQGRNNIGAASQADLNTLSSQVQSLVDTTDYLQVYLDELNA